MEIPETRYAITPDGAYIAYQTMGQGPIDIAWQIGYLSLNPPVDLIWQVRAYAEWFGGLASFSRLILHDRRGTGASSRNVPAPNLETRVADLRTVLDAVGSERPVLGADLEGGAVNVLFAATMPERVHSLFWWYPAPRSQKAPDYPWGMDDEEFDRRMEEHLSAWGTSDFDEFTDDQQGLIPWGFISRHTATPDVAAELRQIWRQTDVRGTLPAVTTPTLLLARDQDREALDAIASLMPHAEVHLFPGASEDLPVIDEQPAVLDAIRDFIGAEAPPPDLDRVLAAVLFTDIVGSTEHLTELGDTKWRSVLARHDERGREEIERHRGRYVDSTGDGLFATFDGPARAVRCAQAIAASVGELGIQIRAGVHTGEVELQGDAVRGIAVHIGARVAALAGPSEVWVSQTVKDLVAGSGLIFEDAGEHRLKGVPDRWHLYRVA